MKDQDKTKEQLISELTDLRQRIAELEASETGRKLAEEGQRRALAEALEATHALQESEEKYSKLFHHSNDGILLHDLDGNILDVNQRVLDLFRYSRSEILSLQVSDLCPPDALGSSRWAFEMIARDGFVSFQTDLERKDGEVFPAEVSSGLFEISGKTVIQDIVRDITERVEAEEALLRYAEQLEALEKAAAVVSSTLELDQVLNRILEQVERVVTGDTFNVMLIENAVARVVRRRGPESSPVEDENATLSVPITAYPNLVRMVRTGESVVVPDTTADSDWIPAKDQERWRSYVGAPIQVGSQTVGFLNVSGARPGQFSLADAHRLEAFASHAATAIKNAQLYQETIRRLAQTSVLREVMLAAASTLDFDLVLDRTIDALGRTLGIEYLGFMLPDEDGQFMRSHPSLLGFTPPPGGIFRFPTDQCVTGQVYRTGCPVILSDVSKIPHYAVADEEVCSELAVPVKVADEVVAVLNLESSKPDAFDEEDLAFYTAIAGQLGVAMENARLYQELQNHAYLLEERVQERIVEIRGQHARLEAILHSITDGIVVTDMIGEILQINPVAQAWLTQVLSPKEARRLRKTIRDLALRADETPELVLELTGLDLELRAAPVMGEDIPDSPAAVVAIHDVTHLKALERMKTRFVSNISHELRTPITTIKLYTHLMRLQPEKWENYLNVLAQEADRQAQLVEDILNISRIDAGRLEMEPCPTPLDKLAKAVTVSHRVLAEEEGVTLEYHPTGSEPVALVDPDRMVQVLNNLVGNAIRYTPDGGKVVVSTAEQKAEGRTWATVTVADTGIGIPMDEMPHIFDRFFRGKEPREMQLPGTGLGLSIVQEIVELHGGWVTVESEKDTGSSFSVWLPLDS